MSYITDLNIGDIITCIKDKYTRYDIGNPELVSSGIVFNKGENYKVDSKSSNSNYFYVLDKNNCLHIIEDKFFIKKI